MIWLVYCVQVLQNTIVNPFQLLRFTVTNMLCDKRANLLKIPDTILLIFVTYTNNIFKKRFHVSHCHTEKQRELKIFNASGVSICEGHEEILARALILE